MNADGKRGVKKLDRVIRIYYMRKKSIFNKVRVKNKAFVILAHKNTY